MGFSIEQILLVGSLLLAVGIFSSKASEKFGIPVQLFFLMIGMLAGSEGPGRIHFEDYALSQTIGTISLVLILFSGGLDSDWKTISPHKWRAFSLSSLGVFITAGIMGAATHFFLGLDWPTSFLLGSIVSSTDASSVFAVFKSRDLELKRGLKQVLEFESGINDPTAYFLVTAFMTILAYPDLKLANFIPAFFWNMSIGVLLGWGIARIFLSLIKRVTLGHEGLYPALVLALLFFTYALTHQFKGNGFLAVYLLGLTLGNRRFGHKRVMLAFYDGVAWLMQVIMFLMLGLLVYPSRLFDVAPQGLVLAFILLLIARPVAVFISLLGAKINRKDKLFVSWVGLRGAVPIVFACFLPLQNIGHADLIFNLVFFIVIISVLFQGTSLEAVSRWCEVKESKKLIPKWSNAFQEKFREALATFRVPLGAWVVGKSVIEASLPKGTLLLYLRRGDKFLTPGGTSVFEAGDEVLVLTGEKSDLDVIQERLESENVPSV
ncbi:MAG: potassium/proton antiporter [Bacteriovoracaceae bacterium]|nr:potassium/proton antiporter [Bacteriovoracaceae bacterium]